MVEVAAVAAIVKIAETLWNAIGKSKEKNLKHRERISDYLEKISKCIQEIAAKFKQNEIPMAECVRLEQYFHDIDNVLRGTIDDRKIVELKELAGRATNARALAMAMKGVDQPAEVYRALDEAIGRFTAIADGLRV